jgi:hypothetical protein
MSVAHHPLPPTSSLPPLRSLGTLTEEQISAALRNLHAIYCPLPQPVEFELNSTHTHLALPQADSGYASEVDDDNEDEDASKPVTTEGALEALRVDDFERDFAQRWLTGFIGRAECGELLLADVSDETLEERTEEVRQRLIDEACIILASFSEETMVENDESEGISREFSFEPSAPLAGPNGCGAGTIRIVLHDAPIQTGFDHTDVGLQTWGASIVLSDLMCADPARFGFGGNSLSAPGCVVELGAGTGLVSLVLAKLLPRVYSRPPLIVASDFHPTVLENLAVNIEANLSPDDAKAEPYMLDWSAPDIHAPLSSRSADVLIAADVVYEPEHAVWLRDCAAGLLAPNGIFWLMASVRPNGRFAGLSDTVQDVFSREDCPKDEDGRLFSITHVDKLEKRKGVGRADECGYKLFRINWA